MTSIYRSSEAPFFIIGVHRSGTTLLRFILSSHSEIYIPEESDFIPRLFLSSPRAPLTRETVRKHLRLIFEEYRFVRDWQGEPPEIDEFWRDIREEPTPAAFLDALYSRYARQHNASRWGDKTPIYASYIPLLHEIFPAARFVHIIRDGRDAALSMLEKYADDEFHVDVYFAARNWVRRICAAQSAAKNLNDEQYLEVRYEELVDSPEGCVRQLCEFLNVDFREEMLTQHQLARLQIPSDSHFFAKVREPITQKRVGRWKSGISPRDQRLIQHVQQPLLEELDYPVADLGSMGVGERVRLSFLYAKYEVLQAGRRILQALGLFPPI